LEKGNFKLHVLMFYWVQSLPAFLTLEFEFELELELELELEFTST